jgi:catechol 2,3-dioxygenase-like lactoylglutathione lyase family enzyme
MSHLELVALVVRDYDVAIRFFVDVLQFKLVEDTPSLTNDGCPKRWVVIRPDGDKQALWWLRSQNTRLDAGMRCDISPAPRPGRILRRR